MNVFFLDRDELMAKAIWLQEHGYFKGVSIIELVDTLESKLAANTYPVHSQSFIYTNIETGQESSNDQTNAADGARREESIRKP